MIRKFEGSALVGYQFHGYLCACPGQDWSAGLEGESSLSAWRLSWASGGNEEDLLNKWFWWTKFLFLISVSIGSGLVSWCFVPAWQRII